jgi:hypothetical protein
MTEPEVGLNGTKSDAFASEVSSVMGLVVKRRAFASARRLCLWDRLGFKFHAQEKTPRRAFLPSALKVHLSTC